VAAVVAAAAALLLTALGAAPIERAEIYFVDGARAMVETGDFLVPRYRGEPFFDKPPLTYWLMAAAFRAFGVHLGAARLVPVVAGLLLIVVTAALGRRLFGEPVGLRSAAVLASTLLFMSFGRVAMSDMLLALLSTTAVVCGLAACDARAMRRDLLLTAAGAALGLGFLTKGPVALLLPGFGLYAFLRERRCWPFTWRGSLLAATAAAALGLGWFAAVYQRLGAGPLEYFFLRENLERFAGETYDSGRSPLFYPLAYLAVGLPWSLVFPVAAARLPRGQRGLLLWTFLMLVPLSLARGKIDYYLLPLLPAASIVIGQFFARATWDRADRAWVRTAAAAFGIGLLLVPLAVARLPQAWKPGAAAQVLLVMVIAASTLVSLAAALRPSPGRLFVALAGSAAAAFLILAAAFLPAFRAGQPNAAVAADVARERRYRPEATLVLCSDPARVQRDVLFLTRHGAHDRCDLWAHAASPLPFLLLLHAEEHRALVEAPGLREVARYTAVPATALTFAGLRAPMPVVPLALMANYSTSDPVAEIKRRRDRKHALRSSGGEADE